MAAAVVLLVGFAVIHQGRAGAAVRNRAAARAVAGQLLAAAILPRSAVPLAQPPVPALRRSMQQPASDNLVQSTRFWRVPIPLGAFRAFARAHPPGGLQFFTGGTLSGPGLPTTYDLGWDRTALPSGIGSLDLIYSFVRLGGSATGLRIDAQVVWRPQRTAATLVPTSDRYAVLTWLLSGAQPGRLVVDIASSRTVRGLIATINRLPTMAVGARNCALSQVTVSLQFSAHRGARPNATATEVLGCGWVSLRTARGSVDLQPGPLVAMERHLAGLTAAQVN
ncbi:MAG TPA: hypothetical protein VMW49_01210 [Candidatus Dormibacteraeota bacterium]|nr:hypothetical protein [Candidatus Dormibacteraeota bacterium]